MSRRHLTMLLALAALWGASFMLIEIGLRDLAPSTLVLGRVATGALALLVWLRLSGRGFSGLRRRLPALALLGALNTAVPFFLIVWGQQHIDSGLAAILNASAPLFTALLALPLDPSQRVGGLRLLGLVLGFAGIVALVGFEPAGGDHAVLGALAVVVASACYALGALYAGRRLRGVPPATVAFGALAFATLFASPAGIVQAGSAGWEALAAVAVLGVGATGVAYLLYFGLIAGAGASRAILVTYLVPPLALVYGVVLLDERITALALVGLALVLAGVALGTRRPRVASPA